MEARERFKVEQYGGDCCDFEESSAVDDAFELMNPDDYPENQRKIVEEYNRRAEIGNQRYRVAMYRAEMFEKGFNAGMYICTFDHDENMTGFVFTDETRRLLGYDGLEDLPDEFDSWVKTLLPEQREAMVPIFWNTVRNHRQLPDISHAEYPMIRKDGKIIWVTGAGRFIRREDGSLEIYMGCYRDVTAEHEKDDYLHIIEGIGKVFNFSLYINLPDGTYQIVSTNEYVEKVQKDPNAFRFLQNNVNSSVHPDFRDELNAWLRPEIISALLKEKDTISKDFYSAEADMWFRGIFMVGDRDEDGSPRHIIYGCQDITYEKRHELEQQRAKEREHIIVDALSASYLNVYVIDVVTQSVEILKLNGYVTRGLSKEKVGPYPYEATCRAYISNRVYREDQQMVTDCMSLTQLLAQLKDRKEYEFTYRVPENDEISYYQGKYVAVDERYIVCGFQNIDAIVKKENEQKEKLQAAYDRLAESKAELDEQYRIMASLGSDYTNVFLIDLSEGTSRAISLRKDTGELLGVRKQEKHSYQKAVERYLSVLRICSEDIDGMRENLRLAYVEEKLRENEEFSGNFRVTENGTIHYYQFKYRKVAGTQYVLLGFQNTDQLVADELRRNKELEKAKLAAEAADHAKSAFLFNMSHDIRTPMNAIIGYANLMNHNQNDRTKWPGYLQKILSSSDFLLGLINNVLEMARIESGKTVLDEKPYALEALVDQLYSVFAAEMAKKELHFTRSVQLQHPYFYCDVIKLREILLNIVSNAQKYTLSGGFVELTLKELPAEQEGYALIQTTVADTGIGMSAEFLPHIFEEFTRENNSVGNQIQGTGLGMPIVKKLVDLMEGTIEVTSVPGKGSTFVVTIPHRIAEKPAAAERAAETIDYSSFAGKQILLAEDNDLNAEIATEILTEAGFKVERAEDGMICVDKLAGAEAGYYDVILMDIQMPRLDGYGAARKIRAMEDSEKAKIPIIAMTANAFEEDKRNALSAGMNGHLAKPITVEELMKTLAAVIG